jgi:signal transduction histidine kinase
MFYKNLKSKNLLLNQNQELHLHRISEMEKEKRLEVMQAILKGQEEERSRLARDLHDGVGGMLSGVKFSLATMKGNVFISEENAAAFNRALAQLDQSISELRHVSHNMMPESLIRYGLAETLENYCTTLNLTKTVQVQLQTYGLQERLEQSTEIILYRVVQELLTNSMRHGEARNILVQLVREQGHFSLTVEDDGKGFDAESEGHKGAGLTNIRARIAYLNGTIDIRSAPGEGTSVYIEGNCS